MKLFQSRTDKRNSTVHFEIIPFISLILILFIFFLLFSTQNSEKNGLKLHIPSASTTAPEKADIIISINQKQEIFFNQKLINKNSLKNQIYDSLITTPDSQILIQADSNTPYFFIIEVLDQIRLAGCFDIVLEANKKLINNV